MKEPAPVDPQDLTSRTSISFKLIGFIWSRLARRAIRPFSAMEPSSEPENGCTSQFHISQFVIVILFSRLWLVSGICQQRERWSILFCEFIPGW
jgi:hypothetical protein